jgi:iron complex transport system permease protein
MSGRVWHVALVAGALLALLSAPFIGTDWINPFAAIQGTLPTIDAEVLWRIRLPRVCLGALAGAGLAISGMTYQSMFRNDLATPYTLGVASGAALGAAIYVVFGGNFAFLGVDGGTLFALIGAIAAVAIVYGLVLLRPEFSGGTILLAGVAVSFFFSSFILFVQYLSDLAGSFRILRWLMGGLDLLGYTAVWRTLPFVLIGGGIVAWHHRELDLLAVGDDVATARGMACARTKKILFAATSLMVGGIVAVCGPIGFVGMMVPHACRLLFGHRHVVILPTSAFFGAVFLVMCDTTARSMTTVHAELPVGIVTALCGGPFFLWLLLRRNNDGRLNEE